MKSVKTILFTCAVVLAVPASAIAAGPTASTGNANNVTATTATLHGTVDPNHNATTFHFEYGRSKAYGSLTPETGTDATKRAQPVAANLTGLAPSTTYHFRIVATGGGSTVAGTDHTFKTPVPPPNSITVAPNPQTTVFGHTTVLAGQLTGPQNAGVTVTLQQQQFPFTTGFQNLTTTPTDNAGNFGFTITPTLNTRYQVQARTNPRVTSPVTQVNVGYATSIGVKTKRVHNGKRVTFSGTVVPAHDGAVVIIEKRSKTGAFNKVATTTLKHSSLPLSTYSRNVRLHKSGTFRVHVIGDANLARVDGFSSSKKIHV
jgi:uncharacterized protein GlcG (DUF336 family)